MGGMIYKLFTSTTLLALGLYHLVCTTSNFLRTPQSYTAKPSHPLSLNNNRLKHIPVYLIIITLLLSFAHQLLLASYSDPLVRGSTPVHLFSSLHSAAVIFLFLIISISLLLSHFPSDLIFALSSAAFFLQYSSSSSSASIQTSNLEAECDLISARVSALSAVLCFLLACRPRLYVADAALAASVCLQGLWQLQTGLSLNVEAFIPEGCHRLLDVVSGVEGSTKCDIEESRLRAVAILDLMFVVHVMFVVLVVFVVYAVVAKAVGIRRLGSYEALPTISADSTHIQMKAMTGTQA